MARWRFALLVLMTLGLPQCTRYDNLEPLQDALFDTRLRPAAQDFSLARNGSELDLVFADRSSLGLVLAQIRDDPSANPSFSLESTTYLDRISDLPGNDPLFGVHILFQEGPERHLLYLDRKTDERSLLKYIHWGSDGGRATIDVLPFTGRPLAALRGEDGALEVYLEAGRQLLRQSFKPAAAAEILRSSFSLAGAVWTLASDRVQGFTAYDDLSHRLIFFRRNGHSLDQTVLAHFGVVHSSAVADDGTVSCLAYDQQQYRIVLFQQDRSSAGFRVQSVTPARDVRCLGMFFYGGSAFFLFSEQTDPRAGGDSYRLSMLVPQAGAGKAGYRRVVLQKGALPITCLRTVSAADHLYVALLQGSVRFLRLDLKNYLRRESD
jgi:hypothetical protein